MESLLQELVPLARDVLVNRYTSVAALTLLVYDYIITFDEEVRLVWPSRFSVAKCLFLANRYLPFCAAILGTYTIVLIKNYDPCRSFLIAATVISTMVYIIAEGILFMRAYAIWGRQRWVSIVLSLSLTGSTGGAYYIQARYLESTAPASVHLFHSGCMHMFPFRKEWITLTFLMFCETLALMLLVVKRYSHFRYADSHLLSVIYKDGVLYFILILCTTIANFFVLLLTSPALDTFLLIPQGILHSILCSRLLLRIRGAYNSLNAEEEQSTQFSKRMIPLDALPLRRRNYPSLPVTPGVHD